MAEDCALAHWEMADEQDTTACGLGSLLLVAGTAGAEPFASHGTVAIGAERIFGLDYTSLKESQGGLEQKSSATSFSLLGHLGVAADPLNPMTALPRLSVDAFVGPGVSLGGALMYQHIGFSRDSDSSTNILLFAPRLGFGARLSDTFAIWPRLGVSYLHTWSTATSTTTDAQGNPVSTERSSTFNYTFLNLDMMFIFTPIQHVGFSFGPTFDYLLGTSQTANGTDVPQPDTTMYALGIQAGLLVWF